MLQHFLDEFLSFVPFQLPQLIDLAHIRERILYDDYALLAFDIPGEYDLEEIMDMLEDDMELIMLYHHILSCQIKYHHSTCAYSNPNFGQMFKMNALTDDNGKVSSISVTIYDSLEYMCSDLCLDLKLHENSGIFKYKRSKDTLLLDFM